MAPLGSAALATTAVRIQLLIATAPTVSYCATRIATHVVIFLHLTAQVVLVKLATLYAMVVGAIQRSMLFVPPILATSDFLEQMLSLLGVLLDNSRALKNVFLTHL